MIIKIDNDADKNDDGDEGDDKTTNLEHALATTIYNFEGSDMMRMTSSS